MFVITKNKGKSLVKKKVKHELFQITLLVICKMSVLGPLLFLLFINDLLLHVNICNCLPVNIQLEIISAKNSFRIIRVTFFI